MDSYLDEEGIRRLWDKVVSKIDAKIKSLNLNIDTLVEDNQNKVVIGSRKNAMIIVTDANPNFISGTAAVSLKSIADAYGKNIENVAAQLKSASSAVITSAMVDNNTATLKCSYLSGTAYSGSIPVTLTVFLA
jgi:gamma-glutamylcysteine synthetase|nr:MAG TPA: hypothetical protein [Caudoviricetes sp.]